MNSDDDQEQELIDLTQPFDTPVKRDLRSTAGLLSGIYGMDSINKPYKASSSSTSMLEIRFKDARGFGIPYSYLRGIDYNFSKQKHSITLHTAIGIFKITGFHLTELKDKLMSSSVQWVKDEGLKEPAEENTPTVSKIVFEEAGK